MSAVLGMFYYAVLSYAWFVAYALREGEVNGGEVKWKQCPNTICFGLSLRFTACRCLSSVCMMDCLDCTRVGLVKSICLVCLGSSNEL